MVRDSPQLKAKIFQSFHVSAIGGHSGQRASYHRVKKIFFWPHMKANIIAWINECPVCQISKVEPVHVLSLLEPLPVPDMAWSHITMDFVEGLPRSKNNNVILVVVHRLTKYAHFLPMSHPFAVHDVADIFLSNIFKLHGLPSCIVTDRDRIFTSALWKDLFKALKMELHRSTSYHPQTYGQSERVNQCLENYLRCMTFQEANKWLTWLPLAEFCYNTSYHTSLKMSPFQSLYGYPPPQVNEQSIPQDAAISRKCIRSEEIT